MQFDQPLPLYIPYPILLPFEQEKEQEQDREVMKSYYSRRALAIQEKVERECDRMEYDGSMMFDEYPDKFMMAHLCGKIEKELLEEELAGAEEEMEMQNRRGGNELHDLIGVLLFNEMYRRRCRHRRCRRYF